jgi:membrane protease YdiL (CAAX protease family)
LKRIATAAARFWAHTCFVDPGEACGARRLRRGASNLLPLAKVRDPMSLSTLLEAAFVLILAVVVPILSFQTSRRPEIKLLPRVRLYLSAAMSQWLLAVLGLGVVWAGSMSFGALGFRAVRAPTFLVWMAVLASAVLLALGLMVWFEGRGWWPPEPELVYALIPRTRIVKVWDVLVIAPTAALCEEFLYRGFLLAALSQWFHSAAWGCTISSIAFGLAHFYQNLSGIVRAALLGALLAVPVICAGTIFPSMAAHFLIDAVVLVWLGPRMVKNSCQWSAVSKRINNEREASK